MEELPKIDFSSIPEKLTDLATTYGIKLILAIVVLVVGLMIVKWITRGAVRMMARANVSESLVPFLKSMISVILKILVFISVLGMVGIEMTSFIAILAAAGLAVGLALQGTFQNFAGGIIILLFKPYKVGDFIETQGYLGSVKEIQIFTTVLLTPDNKTIIIPNSPIATDSLTNFSAQEKRRVDLSFGIGYGDDIEKARAIIRSLIDADERIDKEPEPFVRVSELGDSSVNFAVRVWANTGDYWDIYFDLTENVKKSFDREGVSIPFPQTDVHLYNHTE
ncbi:MAG: mechanosensitive ion channel [Bacteroidales bacterium]|nr:mechanosensitive ion channel [Bacteroidales bacterium]